MYHQISEYHKNLIREKDEKMRGNATFWGILILMAGFFLALIK